MTSKTLIYCSAQLSLIVFFQSGYAQSNDVPNGWKAFAKVKFEPRPMEGFEQLMLVPQFDERITALEGKQVELKGFVMPFDYGDRPLVILSKYPYSSCFFCGAAGPESVAEVYFKDKPKDFEGDEQITIVGKLRLNVEDVQKMNFILEDSKVVDH